MCEAGSGWAARTPVGKERQVGRPGSFPKELQGLTVGEAGCRLGGHQEEKEEKDVRCWLVCFHQLFDSDIIEKKGSTTQELQSYRDDHLC